MPEAPTGLPVTFYLPDETDLPRLQSFDPDVDWRRMQRGQRWTLQTYLRLSSAGHPVRLSDRLPDDGIVVFMAFHHRIVQRRLGSSRAILVSIRGDKKETFLADFEIVQNGRFADGRRRFFVPYWPQPGLMPRGRGRGARIGTVSFKGFARNLHPYFLSGDWQDWLRRESLEWIDATRPPGVEPDLPVDVDWHDYRSTDVVVGYRRPDAPDAARLYTSKPAAKLYNCWHAGAPAILGPEHAYREQRRSELDYIEIERPEHAKEAILRLRSDPSLYLAMVENGLERAADFSRTAVTDRWAEVLFDRIPREVSSRRFRATRAAPMAIRKAAKRLRRLATFTPRM